MICIWKYEVEPDFVNQNYIMPEGAIILSFGLDGSGKMCFWAQVDTEAPKVEHNIACVGTGWGLDVLNNKEIEYACFIGSLTHGPYVWHLFDLGAGACSKNDKAAPSSAHE